MNAYVCDGEIPEAVAAILGPYAVLAGGSVVRSVLGLPVPDWDVFFLNVDSFEAAIGNLVRRGFGVVEVFAHTGGENYAHERVIMRYPNGGPQVDLIFNRKFTNFDSVLATFDLAPCRAFATETSRGMLVTFTPEAARSMLTRKLEVYPACAWKTTPTRIQKYLDLGFTKGPTIDPYLAAANPLRFAPAEPTTDIRRTE